MDRAAGAERQLATALSLCAVLSLVACGGKAHPPGVRYHGGDGKIPITTVSEQAYRAFLTGRDLEEKLRGTDAREYYEQALELDPDFAMAYLALTTTSPDGNAFFESLERAVQLVDRVSPGERAMILGLEAGVRGDPEGRREHYETLVQLYPDDERAHTVLGNHLFGRREWKQAIEHYEQAVELAPEFSQPYNQLGYAYRFLGSWSKAEKAFTRYIELIPEEPNPYDSYAEMLMKMGRFEESIEVYRTALSYDPEFVPSYVGIGNNRILMGDTAAARETFDRLHTVARTANERRTALLWTAVAHLHDGNRDAALATLERRFGEAERHDDIPSMVEDLQLIADVQLEAGEAEGAGRSVERALQLAGRAELPDDFLEAFRNRTAYFEARLALARNDIERARAIASGFESRARTRNAIGAIGRAGELHARVALAEGDYREAMRHLETADDRDPRVLDPRAVACSEAGELERSRAAIEKIANYNGMHVNLAHVRRKARALLAEPG